MYQGPTGGRPANRPPNRAAGGWRARQGPMWRPVSSNALLGGALVKGFGRRRMLATGVRVAATACFLKKRLDSVCVVRAEVTCLKVLRENATREATEFRTCAFQVPANRVEIF